MRKIGFGIFFSFLTSFTFGQQFLWSTVQRDTGDEKYIPIDYVANEVLKFYDHYEMHYDLSGFSKERFMNEMDYGFDDWEWMNDINDLTVFAFRSNVGTGSIVLVMCISEDNVNSIIFSNQILDGNFNYLSNSSYKKEKFETWFKTLLN